jgi:tetratricopeptide (TPR) repeat protein
VLSEIGLGTEGRERLLREAQAIAKLSHPNIVSVFDAGEEDAVPYIVMELIEGASLHEKPPEDIQAMVNIAIQVCAALEHAHEQDVVHRDLKPENVLVDQDGTAKLMDFGIARSMASRLTATGEITGTVFYLAPEIALGQDFDGRADLYSLGVMLYELAAGELPFASGDPLAVISQHLHTSVIPPRARNPEVPPRLDSLILDLMEKAPEHRISSAREARELLERKDLLDPEAEEAQGIAVIRRIVRGRFVGRDNELQKATSLWNQALSGEGQTLLISGEPGIGKTRLMRELSTHVEVTGGNALIGECESEGGAPYAPFAQIVRKALRRGSENGFNLPEFVLGDLLKLAPELKPYYPDVPPNPHLEPEAEQQRLFENVVAFCQNLSDYEPLLLVIDDAHWADSGSLALLKYLAGRTQKQRTLIVATYREVELDEARPFHETLLELNRKRLGTRLKLKRFSADQTRDMLSAIFDSDEITPEFLDGIHGETEGNPFFVEEVCKALVEQGQVFHTEEGWDRLSMEEMQIPQSVRVAIQSRVSKFPDEYQDTLNLAAILGREFDFDTLAAASDRDEDTLIDALEAAEQAQLIEEVSGEGGATFSFMHALIPTTLAEGVRTLRRRRLHKRAAQAIEATRPDDYEDLAHHFEEAGDEESGRVYYTKAGDRASAAFANQEAEDHYRAALELEPSDAERADLQSALAETIARVGQYDEAIDIWKDTAAKYQNLGNVNRVAWCYTRMARARWWSGDMPGALDLAEQGMEQVEGTEESPEYAALIHETARAHYFLGHAEDAVSFCNRALKMARQSSDRRVEADTLITLGILPGVDIEDAIDALKEAIQISQAENLPVEESRAHNNLGVLYDLSVAKFRTGREHYYQAAEIARKLGNKPGEIFTLNNAASNSIIMGELAQAKENIEHIEQLLGQIEDPGTAGTDYQTLIAFYEHAMGNLEGAAERRRSELQLSIEAGSTYEVGFRSFQLGFLLVTLELLDEAISVLRKGVKAADQLRGGRVFNRTLLASALARKGDITEAKQIYDEATQFHAEHSRAWAAATLQIAEAEILAAENKWDEAFTTFSEATEMVRQAEARFTRSTILHWWARAHLQRGEPEDVDRARELLQEMATELEDMGSPQYAQRIQDRIDELGS